MMNDSYRAKPHVFLYAIAALFVAPRLVNAPRNTPPYDSTLQEPRRVATAEEWKKAYGDVSLEPWTV